MSTCNQMSCSGTTTEIRSSKLTSIWHHHHTPHGGLVDMHDHLAGGCCRWLTYSRVVATSRMSVSIAFAQLSTCPSSYGHTSRLDRVLSGQTKLQHHLQGATHIVHKYNPGLRRLCQPCGLTLMKHTRSWCVLGDLGEPNGICCESCASTWSCLTSRSRSS